MPTYEFRCPDGSVIERVFKMSDVPDTIPTPDGEGVAVRMISGGADLIFKGSGFYITDYGKDGKKDLRESASRASEKGREGEAKASDSGGGDGGKGDSGKPGTGASEAGRGDSGVKPASKAEAPAGDSAAKKDPPKPKPGAAA